MEVEHSGQSHWIPLADLMTGLMMIFMLLTAAYMLRVEQTTTLVVKEYEQTRSDLKRALQDAFAEDLKQWNAEMLGDMTIQFKNPDVLFRTGQAELQPQFKAILADFFPRYVEVISNDRFRSSIQEIRIEGHTSAIWAGTSDPEIAYTQNMRLSQERTRSTLEFLLQLPALREARPWLKSLVTANGLSSSRLANKEDPAAAINQRVEFRIVTNADRALENIATQIGIDR